MGGRGGVRGGKGHGPLPPGVAGPVREFLPVSSRVFVTPFVLFLTTKGVLSSKVCVIQYKEHFTHQATG